MLADRAVAAEKDIDKGKPGVAEINVSESGKLDGRLDVQTVPDRYPIPHIQDYTSV